MSETSAAVSDRKRKRTVEDGKVITNVPPEVGCYIAREADEAGIAPATFARMLLVEAIKARGLSKEDLLRLMQEQEEGSVAAVV